MTTRSRSHFAKSFAARCRNTACAPEEASMGHQHRSTAQSTAEPQAKR